MQFLEYEPLARYTSWRIGGPARYLAQATTTDELQTALGWARERELPMTLLGGGTNTLVRDAGFDGLVLRYRDQQLRIDEQDQQVLVTIAAGAPTAGTIRRLARQGWGGLEWAEGLPGTIGGAVSGNAGCYGGDMAAVLTRAWLLVEGQVEEWPLERLEYGYRTSVLKDRQLITQQGAVGLEDSGSLAVSGASQAIGPIVVAAEFMVHRADPVILAERMEQTAAARRSKTPAGQSCGSVFKNPPGDSSGRLIEAAGLKGMRVGGAEVAQKHANYIVNLGGASSDDVLRLIDIIRERVLREYAIELELEVRIV